MHTQPVSFTAEVPRKAVCSQHPVKICGLNAGKLKHLESQQHRLSSSLPPPTAGNDVNYVLGTVLYTGDTTGSSQAQEATMTENHTVQGLICSMMSSDLPFLHDYGQDRREEEACAHVKTK